MNLFHGIIVCERDKELCEAHVEETLKVVPGSYPSCFYWGKPGPVGHFGCHVVPVEDTYANLPVKTFCMLRHALTFPDWDIFLKTDVNTRLLAVDWNCLYKYDLIGYMRLNPDGTSLLPTRRLGDGQVNDPVYTDRYNGPMPVRWVGGPAYALTRRLAQAVVDQGIWFARSWPWEDLMVSYVCETRGWDIGEGVSYWPGGILSCHKTQGRIPKECL
jgi:hypothetical protein